MKQLPMHILHIVVLLCCIVGCDSRPWNSSIPYYGNSMAFGNWNANGFEVDGNTYKTIGICRSDAGGRENLSWIAVYRVEAKNRYSIATASNRDKIEGYICYIDADGNEITRVEAPFNSVYFVGDGKIVYSKTNRELGLDIRDEDTAFSQENLQPILEKLIRENLPKSEAKQEPENVK